MDGVLRIHLTAYESFFDTEYYIFMAIYVAFRSTTQSSPGARSLGDPVERLVYARHGRELMG